MEATSYPAAAATAVSVWPQAAVRAISGPLAIEPSALAAVESAADAETLRALFAVKDAPAAPAELSKLLYVAKCFHLELLAQLAHFPDLLLQQQQGQQRRGDAQERVHVKVKAVKGGKRERKADARGSVAAFERRHGPVSAFTSNGPQPQGYTHEHQQSHSAPASISATPQPQYSQQQQQYIYQQGYPGLYGQQQQQDYYVAYYPDGTYGGMTLPDQQQHAGLVYGAQGSGAEAYKEHARLQYFQQKQYAHPFYRASPVPDVGYPSSEPPPLPFMPSLIAAALKHTLVTRAQRSSASLMYLPVRIGELVRNVIALYPHLELILTERAIYLAVELTCVLTTEVALLFLQEQCGPARNGGGGAVLLPETLAELVELTRHGARQLGGFAMGIQGLQQYLEVDHAWTLEMGAAGAEFKAQMAEWARARGEGWLAMGADIVHFLRTLCPPQPPAPAADPAAAAASPDASRGAATGTKMRLRLKSGAAGTPKDSSAESTGLVAHEQRPTKRRAGSLADSSNSNVTLEPLHKRPNSAAGTVADASLSELGIDMAADAPGQEGNGLTLLRPLAVTLKFDLRRSSPAQ